MLGLEPGDEEGRSTVTSQETLDEFILMSFFKQNHI